MSRDVYIPVAKRDARYPIWNVYYEVRIPYNQFFSITQLRTLGMPASPDSAMDRAIQKSDETKMMSINEMFEYWRAGVAPKLTHKADTVKVYEAIAEYLSIWKKTILEIPRIDAVPLADLAALDEFAQKVYDRAKYNFAKTEVDSILARRMSSILQFNRGNILIDKPKKSAEPQKEEEEVDPYPKRDTDTKDFFESIRKAQAARIK